MEQTDNVGRSVFERLKENSTLIFIILGVIMLFIFPGLLVILVPIIIGVYAKKHSTQVAGISGVKLKKRKDPRRFWVAVLILFAALLIVYADSRNVNDFMGGVMLIGICTGGFIWAPLAAYLSAMFLLFVYDKVTGKTAYVETALDTSTIPPVIAAAALAPTLTQAPTLAPDLSALSPTDQSLVIYIAEASARGVLGGEITLILKSTGWLDADILRGFELVRRYYPGVLN